MTFLNFVVYLLPFVVFVLSIVSWRYTPHRRTRLLAYVPILVGAEVAALMSISLRNDLLDIVVSNLFLFMALELFWQLMKIKNAIWRGLVLVLGLVCVISIHIESLRIGPTRQQQRWVSTGEARMVDRGAEYWVRQSYVHLPDSISAPGRPPLPPDGLFRRFTLVRNIPFTPLEKTCDSFVCPRGYEHSAFSYIWSYGDAADPRVGQTVKLFVDGYALWGLKEQGLVN